MKDSYNKLVYAYGICRHIILEKIRNVLDKNCRNRIRVVTYKNPNDVENWSDCSSTLFSQVYDRYLRYAGLFWCSASIPPIKIKRRGIHFHEFYVKTHAYDSK